MSAPGSENGDEPISGTTAASVLAADQDPAVERARKAKRAWVRFEAKQANGSDEPPRSAVVLSPIETPVRAEGRRGFWIALAVGATIGGCFVYQTSRDQPRVAPTAVSTRVVLPPPPETAVEEPRARLTEETSDAGGRTTRIVGSDPTRVLEAYCSAGGPFDRRDPIGIRDDPAGKRTVRLGVLRRDADPARAYALWIRYDSRTGKWFVGDGRNPVEAYALDR